MKDISVAVIGGSGLYDLDTVNILEQHVVDTPFGDPSSPVVEAELSDPDSQEKVRFYFLSRHGQGHTISPSEINFRANIFALKKLGAKYAISFSAVGSLKEELSPRTFVLPDQFIDWTKGLRKRSFFADGLVGHVSTAVPVEPALLDIIAGVLKKFCVKYSKGGTYICIEGPQFSSKAESALYRSLGASVIGMTNIPEAYLAKEAGIAYATINMVTDYDCWREEHCAVEEILKVMDQNNRVARDLIQKLVPYLAKNPVEYTPENRFAVITHDDELTQNHKEILEVLLDF
jgi:5'-methylthioadenosine phosphorylase